MIHPKHIRLQVRLGVCSVVSSLAFAALWLSPTGAHAVGAPPATNVAIARCSEASPSGTSLTAPPLPSIVTGRVAFYAGLYPPGQRDAKRSLSLGDSSQLFPTASMFKTLTVYATMNSIERGAARLTDKITTTPATQSIEAFLAGSNSLERLAQRAIQNSDNTANDLLQLRVGPSELSRSVSDLSRCTTVLLTTKAWWAAQAGLLPGELGENTLAGAQTYAGLPFEQRVAAAGRLIDASMGVTAKQVETGLEAYFHGPRFDAKLELLLQNTTTPRAYANLLSRVMPATDLTRTRQTFRRIMTTGCCIPKKSLLTPTYRAAKAGSGWRVLTMSGYLEFSNGYRVTYTYMNDQSQTLESEDMERQIKPIGAWIERAIQRLL